MCVNTFVWVGTAWNNSLTNPGWGRGLAATPRFQPGSNLTQGLLTINKGLAGRELTGGVGVQPAGFLGGYIPGRRKAKHVGPNSIPHSPLRILAALLFPQGEGMTRGSCRVGHHTGLEKTQSALHRSPGLDSGPTGGPVTAYFWALGTFSLPQGRIWASILCTPKGRAGRARGPP